MCYAVDTAVFAFQQDGCCSAMPAPPQQDCYISCLVMGVINHLILWWQSTPRTADVTVTKIAGYVRVRILMNR